MKRILLTILILSSILVLAEKVYVMKFGWIDPPDPYNHPTIRYNS